MRYRNIEDADGYKVPLTLQNDPENSSFVSSNPCLFKEMDLCHVYDKDGYEYFVHSFIPIKYIKSFRFITSIGDGGGYFTVVCSIRQSHERG